MIVSLSYLAASATVPCPPVQVPKSGHPIESPASSVNCQKGFVLLDNCLPRWKNKGGRGRGRWRGEKGGREGGPPDHKRRNWCVSLLPHSTVNWMAAGSLSTERERERGAAAAQTLVARTSVVGKQFSLCGARRGLRAGALALARKDCFSSAVV